MTPHSARWPGEASIRGGRDYPSLDAECHGVQCTDGHRVHWSWRLVGSSLQVSEAVRGRRDGGGHADSVGEGGLVTGLVGFRMAPGVIPADDGQVAYRRITDRVKHCSARALGSWISVAWTSDSQATPSAVTAPAATGSRNSMTSEVAFLLALGVLF